MGTLAYTSNEEVTTNPITEETKVTEETPATPVVENVERSSEEE